MPLDTNGPGAQDGRRGRRLSGTVSAWSVPRRLWVPRRLFAAAGFCVGLALAADARAQSPAAVFPEGRLAAVHVASGRALIGSGPVARLRAGLAARGALPELERAAGAVRLATGSDPLELGLRLFGGEVEAGVYDLRARQRHAGRERELLVAARAADADELRLVLDAVLAGLSAASKVTPRRNDYEGQPVVHFGDRLHVARHGTLLLASTDEDLLLDALDRSLSGADAPAGPLVAPPGGLLGFALDAGLVRDKDLQAVSGPARKAFGKKVANPLGHLLFGGLFGAAPPVSGTVSEEGDALRIAARAALTDAPAAYFPAGSGTLDVPVDTETIAVLSLSRDFAEWWRRRESLLPEESQPMLAKADESLSILFAGLSPAEDVFSQLRPEVALVVDRQRFDDGRPVPGVRLPGACLVARLADAQDFAPTLAVAFQSLVGFLNANRAQDRRAPFLIEPLGVDGVTVRSARLLLTGDDGIPLDANASPALAVDGDLLLVGTSTEQVERLLAARKAGSTRPVGRHLALDVDVAAVHAALADNRDALIARKLVEGADDPDAAAAEVDRLLDLLSELDHLGAEVGRDGNALTLDLTLRFTGAAR